MRLAKVTRPRLSVAITASPMLASVVSKRCRAFLWAFSAWMALTTACCCERLNRAIPIRVDRAGNISKRQSATSFHFSRVGGSCPLWNVYEAFTSPGRISRQLAQMPDGRSYLWIARTVSRHAGGFHDPGKTFAIGLGCDIRHAPRLVYADDLDLDSPAALTPIGPGCKLCDRPACPQRAFPAIGKPIDTSGEHTRFAPYSTSPG